MSGVMSLTQTKLSPLMFLIIVLGPLVVQIPMAVLAGIMIVVCIGTFDWGSFKYLVKAPRSDAFVMVATVVIVVWTNDLSKGVIAGVILSALFFVIKISSVKVIEKGTTYQIEGQLFFASTESFVDYFKNQQLAATAITIDFTNSKIWDESAVVAIMKVEELLKQQQIDVHYEGLDASSQKILEQLHP